MNTFSKMWGISTPQEAKDIIASQIADLNITEPYLNSFKHLFYYLSISANWNSLISVIKIIVIIYKS